MSFSYHVYVGPYITVYNPKKPAKEEIYACGNPKCKQFKNPASSKHCPDCGHKIQLVEVPTAGRVDMWKILSDLNETFAEACEEYKADGLEDYSILIPNKETGFARHFSAYDTSVIQTNWALVQTDEAAFWKKFEKEIRVLQEKFGKINVTVVWGVVAYAC